MRICLLLLLALALPATASAMCWGLESVTAWPEPTAPLAPNGQIHLMIPATADTARAVLVRHPPVLVRGEERVPLKIEAIEDPYRIGTAVILSPVRWLRPDAEYTLAFDRLSAKAVEELGASAGWPAAGHPVPRWHTARTPDWSPPVWTAKPVVWPGSYRLAGCGPMVSVPVVTRVSDDRPGVHIRATVWPADGSAPETLHIGITNLGINLGHGMCSGAFALEPTRRYRVQLEAVDTAGNHTPAPGDPLEIVWPGPAVIAAPPATP